MPKINSETLTIDHIKELARRLAAAAESLEGSAERLADADLSEIETGVATAKMRIKHIEGFARTVGRKSQEAIDEVREDAVIYKSRGRKKKN